MAYILQNESNYVLFMHTYVTLFAAAPIWEIVTGTASQKGIDKLPYR